MGIMGISKIVMLNLFQHLSGRDKAQTGGYLWVFFTNFFTNLSKFTL